MAKNKANIEIAVNASNAQKEISKLIDEFEEFSESASETTDSVNKVEESIEELGDEGGKSLIATKSKMAQVGGAAVVLNQVLELMGKVWDATFGRAVQWMDDAKALARDMRSEFDPLVMELDMINNEFGVLKASIGDASLIAETGIKKSLIPVLEILQKQVLGQKTDWAIATAEMARSVMQFGAVLISSDGLGGLYLEAELIAKSYWEKVKGLWYSYSEAMEVAAKWWMELLPGDWSKEVETAAGRIKGFGEQAERTKQKVKDLEEGIVKQKEKLDTLAIALYNAGDAAVAHTRQLADQNKGFSNLAVSDFTKRLNALVHTYGNKLPAAFKKFHSSLSLQDKIVQFQFLQNDIDKVGAALMRLKPGDATAFDDMEKKVKGFYSQLNTPLILDFKTATPEQKLEALMKAFDLIKDNANIATREISQDLATATREATALEEKAVVISESFSDRMRASTAVLGQAFSTMFSSMVTESKTAGEALKQFANILLTTVIDALIMTMQASATKTVIGAAESLSWLPIVGPGAATTAAIAMLGFLKGIMGAFMGAKEGGFVTGGIQRKDSVPIMLQPGEYVMPLDEVKGMKKFASQMGAGEGSSFGGRGGGRGSQINVSFNSTLPATRTQAKEIMKRDILPLIRSLEAGGY